MRYQIGVTIYNTFEVEADSREEAQNKVRDYCNDTILTDCDFNISYADALGTGAGIKEING